MKKLSLKQGILFFYLFDIILVSILLLSFLPVFNKNKEVSTPTALLNPNYINQISSISIKNSDARIKLEKGDRYWTGSSTASKDKYSWPADVQIINNLIEESSKLIKVQTKSDNISSWKALGVDEQQSTSITFYDDAGSILSQLFFGFKDNLSLKLYFRTWSKKTVYETVSSMDDFLNTDESFWADSYLYPQMVTDYDKNTSESLLRRGKLQNITPRDGLPVDFNLTKDFENGSTINFAIYKKDEEFIVIPTFKSGPATAEKDKQLIENLNYRYSISSWTLENLLK